VQALGAVQTGLGEHRSVLVAKAMPQATGYSGQLASARGREDEAFLRGLQETHLGNLCEKEVLRIALILLLL
jgi:hypothetical protein